MTTLFRISRRHAVYCVRVGLGLAVFLATESRAASGHSPEVDVLGSYFPAWLVCIVAGLALAIIARSLIVAAKLRSELLPVVYPCLVAIFAMTVWLIFFQN